MISEELIWELLRGIESGRVWPAKRLDFEAVEKWGYLICHYGNVEFDTNNGWKLVVFFDCGGWDNLDSVTTPNGETLEYYDFSQELKNYRPSDDVCKVMYGEPGYSGGIFARDAPD